MEKKVLEVRCVNGHEAHFLCILESCSHASPICEEKECEYSRKHKGCLAFSRSNELIECIINKRTLLSREIDQEIIGFIGRLIKMLETLREEYLSIRENFSDSLIKVDQNEKQVIDLIERGHTKDLKPSLVSNCIKSLSNKEDIESKEHLLKIKEVTDEVYGSILKEVNRIRKVISLNQTPTFQPYLFTKQLCDSSFISIQNEGRTIKVIKSSGYNIAFSLISPSLNETTNRKIRLKLKSLKGFAVYFGVASMTEMLKSSFTWPQNDIGIHVVRSNGCVFNHKDTNQHKKQFLSFGIYQGDQIQMEYFPSLNQLKITNLSSKKKIILNNLTDDEQDLHFAIGTRSFDQQIQITEQK